MTRAAVLREQGGPIEVVDVDLPEPGPGQVRVRIAAAGVCHSDLSLADGSLAQPVPAVLGHEASGVVTQTGPGVTRVRAGDEVILVWSPPCRDCWFCRRGEPYLCEHSAPQPYAELDGVPVWPGLSVGAFAEETVVAERGVVALQAGLPLETAALVGCAVTTGVGAVTRTARVREGESVAVVGCGGVGLSIVQGARLAGAARIVAVDVVAAKRDLAVALGATDAVAEDPVRAIRELTGGYGVDHAFEAVGRAETIKLAWKLARRGGSVTVVGVGRRDDPVSFSALELFHQARRLQGCVFGSTDPDRDFPAVAAAYAEGRLDLDRLVTRRTGLDGVAGAFSEMSLGGSVRTLVIPPLSSGVP